MKNTFSDENLKKSNHNSPLKGIGVRDIIIIIILGDFNFFLLAGRFSIGCGSKFRAEVAYLQVGSSDLEPIHETHVFRLKF